MVYDGCADTFKSKYSLWACHCGVVPAGVKPDLIAYSSLCHNILSILISHAFRDHISLKACEKVFN